MWRTLIITHYYLWLPDCITPTIRSVSTVVKIPRHTLLHALEQESIKAANAAPETEKVPKLKLPP